MELEQKLKNSCKHCRQTKEGQKSKTKIWGHNKECLETVKSYLKNARNKTRDKLQPSSDNEGAEILEGNPVTYQESNNEFSVSVIKSIHLFCLNLYTKKQSHDFML